MSEDRTLCPPCNGEGIVRGWRQRWTCDRCDGTGTVSADVHRAKEDLDTALRAYESTEREN